MALEEGAKEEEEEVVVVVVMVVVVFFTRELVKNERDPLNAGGALC